MGDDGAAIPPPVPAPEAPEWPAYFPPGVPPAEAVNAAGQVFRIVRTVPPTEIDFRTHYEDRAGQDLRHPIHLACGLSVYSALEACRRTRERFPPLRTRHIAVGTLIAAFGKMMTTGDQGSCHITLWVRVGIELHPAFAEDAEHPHPDAP